MTEDDRALVADLIGWARRAWYAGSAPQPVALDVARLAQLERIYRAQPADVGGSVPFSSDDPDAWITVATAAVRYGVPRRTLTDWVRSGRVRSYRVGSGLRAPVLIAADDLQQLLESKGPHT